jgi:hypothetical protein
MLAEWSIVHRGANDAACLEEPPELDALPVPDPVPVPPATTVPEAGAKREIDPATQERIRGLRARTLLGKSPKEKL